MFKYEHTRGSLKLGGDYSFKVCVGGGGGGGGGAAGMGVAAAATVVSLFPGSAHPSRGPAHSFALEV